MDKTRERRVRSSSSSSFSLSESAMFSQRIVCVDFYSAPPIRDMDVMYSEFRGYEVKRVPVIRIYGSTPKGQKTCTHVHCVFPYIYIPYDPAIDNMEYRLAIALDQAINLAIGTKDPKNFHHVFKIIKVTGKSMYGFHGSNDTFLKIFFYNPWMVKKAAELLQNGVVLNKKFQPYEAHIPYQLQFLIDYSLYGMNLVHYSSVKFRRDNDNKASYSVSPSSSSLLAFTAGGGQKVWDVNQIPEYLCAPFSLDKMTRSELEVDVLGSDILVGDSKSAVRSSNPGIDAIWMDEMERRRQGEVENWSQITIPLSQNRSFDNQRFPMEEEHMKTLLNNMAKSDETVENIYQPDDSQSIDSQLFAPSSQLNRHTPSNITFAEEARLTSTVIKSNRADEDLLNLLYEMENEKEHVEEIEEIGSSLGSQVVDAEDPHVVVVEEEQVDDLWNESFFSDTLIDDMLENADKISDAIEKPSEDNVMIQMDGQDDEDSSDEEQNEKVRPRRSVRLSGDLTSSGQKRTPRKPKKLEDVEECPTNPKAQSSEGTKQNVRKKGAAAKLIALATSPRTSLLRKSTINSINAAGKGTDSKTRVTTPQKTSPASGSSTTLRSSPRISLKTTEKISKVPAKRVKSISNKLNVKMKCITPVSSSKSVSIEPSNILRSPPCEASKEEALDPPSESESKITTNADVNTHNVLSRTPVKNLELSPSKIENEIKICLVPCDVITPPKSVEKCTVIDTKPKRGRPNTRNIQNILPVKKFELSPSKRLKSNVTEPVEGLADLKDTPLQLEIQKVDGVSEKCGSRIEEEHKFYVMESIERDVNVIDITSSSESSVKSRKSSNRREEPVSKCADLQSSESSEIIELADERETSPRKITRQSLSPKKAVSKQMKQNEPNIQKLESPAKKNVVVPKIQSSTPKVCKEEVIDLTCNSDPVTVREFSDVSCQTEIPDLPIFGPICRCLSEMAKTFKDQGLDTQADLIKTEVKKIQTEMGDILAEMKRSGNRLTGCTPSKRQEKTTPTRQSGKTKSNERELVTPTSSKWSSSGSNQSKVTTPRLSPNSSIYCKYSSASRTPSPRKAVRKSSQSPISPNLLSSPKVSSSSSLASRYRRVSIGRVHKKKSSPWKALTKKFDQVEEDLSVNSVYEYDSSQEKDGEFDGTQVMSQFQKRRSETKARTWNRVQNRKAKLLLAFNLAPDICEFEFEPMKPAPSFKVLEKWLLTKDKRPTEDISASIKPKLEKVEKAKTCEELSSLSSDEEKISEVRRAAGGNLSDDDEDDDCLNDTCASLANSSINVLSPHTPSTYAQSQSQSQYTCSSSASNPRSILKLSTGRRISDKAKRKIRWEDEAPSKKGKPEELRKEAIIRGASPLPLSQTSWSGFANISELDGPSPKNMFGFEHNMSNLQDAKALHHNQYLTTMCVEIHCGARGDLVPDPAHDSINAIFVYIVNDVPEGHKKPRRFFHNLIVDVDEMIKNSLIPNSANEYLPDEISMIQRFISLVNEWDPDIFVGYEILRQSWGYIIERGGQLGINMINELSRIVARQPQTRRNNIESWNEMIAGRIVLNLWRLLRHEITVQSYTYENAAYHILHKRVHLFSYKQLASYWMDPLHRHKVFTYYYERTKGAIDIIEKLDLINRTSELARLFGIQFYEVLSRGSQFRVESMMLRVAKPKNFVPASPSISQRAKMRAPEFLPLILEPHSNYFTDPVAVLDFQSLYPSMIIAYNYDYTTCLGRVEHLGKQGSFDLGCLDLSVPIDTLKSLRNNIHISPAGVAFVNSTVTKGILPEMLEQILETRQMVKRAMKRWKGQDESLLKILDSRQLGLKLIANVTYGYTSANFSGRMPCIEIGDSVVSKGRETLTRAIDHVKANYDRWKADVVYGDTDSLFVRFIGRTREEAFVLAQEIADEVTQANPKPVKLKLEKIYQPCILQSKKRYVGYSYETADQTEPKYDAKGIETVRRDGCPAVKKILEKALHILFKTNSSVNVQQYVESQFRKVFIGRVSLQEFTFAREYRGRSGYKPAACVPSLEIAKKIIQKDPRAEPLASQRVPYVIVYGNPRLPLIQLVHTPLDFVNNPNLRLNAHYYIEKVMIPALNRCLLSAKMDAHKWYSNLPRRYLRANCEPKDSKQGTLAHFFTSLNCMRCDGNTHNKTFICDTCREDGVATSVYLQRQCFDIAQKTSVAQRICQMCSEEVNKCLNTDCPLFHKLIRYERDDEKYRQILTRLNGLDW